MLPNAKQTKKMVTTIKKRKSSISQNDPEAKTPKKGVAQNASAAAKNAKTPIRTPRAPQTSIKTPRASQTPAKKSLRVQNAKSPLANKPKPTPAKKVAKQNGNKTDEPKPKFEKRTPAKNLIAQKPKAGKPQEPKATKTPIPKVVKPEESEDSDKNAKQEKTSRKAQRSLYRRASIKEKFVAIRDKVGKGDKAAIDEVTAVVKKLEERGDLSRSAKRKLRMYKSLVAKATGKPKKAVAKTPKPKKAANKKVKKVK